MELTGGSAPQFASAEDLGGDGRLDFGARRQAHAADSVGKNFRGALVHGVGCLVTKNRPEAVFQPALGPVDRIRLAGPLEQLMNLAGGKKGRVGQIDVVLPGKHAYFIPSQRFGSNVRIHIIPTSATSQPRICPVSIPE